MCAFYAITSMLYAAKHISENKTIEKARWACFPDGKICLEDITDVYP